MSAYSESHNDNHNLVAKSAKQPPSVFRHSPCVFPNAALVSLASSAIKSVLIICSFQFVTMSIFSVCDGKRETQISKQALSA